MTEHRKFRTPQSVADEGERLYNERHREALERQHPGKHVAIDVLTGNAYLGASLESALHTARRQAPSGLFHLIKIGSPGVSRVSHLLHALAGKV